MKLLLLFLLTLTLIYAAPAYNKTRTLTQSDGTTFEAKAYGNQHLNWIETTDGTILKYNKANKNFEYAIIENRQLKPSGSRYENNTSKVKSRNNTSKIDKDNLYKLWGEKQNIANEKRKNNH